MTAEARGGFVAHVLTVIVAAGLGVVGVLMHGNGQLGYILAVPFHLPVLIAGCALLALVAVRAACAVCEALGRRRGARAAPGCVGRDHDPSWECSKLVLLAFPVGLFLIGVPNSGFSCDRIRMLLGADDAITCTFDDMAHRNGTVTTLAYLHDAAADADVRAELRGQTAILEGRVSRIDDRQFTLYRLRMTCCAADVVPLKVRVILKNGTLGWLNDADWVRMTGRIDFVQPPNSERYIPVVVVDGTGDFQKTRRGNEYDRREEGGGTGASGPPNRAYRFNQGSLRSPQC